MLTIKRVMARLTDPTGVLQEVRKTLRVLDPEYPEEEKQYLQAAAVLEQELGPRAREYLAALEQEITSDIIFVGWQGFQLKLACFHDPVNKLLLREDFEDLHLEHRMPMLPMAQAARRTMDAFLASLPPEKAHLTAGITGYYAYLQTTVYKLAHYYGFCLADRFLYHAVPGYASDPILVDVYTRKMRAFMETDLSALTA